MSGLSVSATFDLFKGDSTTVKVEHVPTIVRSQGLSPTHRQLQQTMQAAGISDAGTATLQQVETVAANLKHTKNEDIEGTIRQALKMFDNTGGDVVAISELSHILSSIGSKMSVDDIDEIFRQAEVDTFGQLDIDDFARLMMRAAGEEENAIA
eukprot:gene669-3969_t